MDITLWGELALFIILMGFSGFFSSAEASLFSLSKIQLEQLRRDAHTSLNRIEVLFVRQLEPVTTGDSAAAVTTAAAGQEAAAPAGGPAEPQRMRTEQ